MLFTLVLLFVLNQQIVLEKETFKTLEECVERGQARLTELELHPKYKGAIAATCVPLPGQAVKS